MRLGRHPVHGDRGLHGQLRCDARLLAVEPLEAMVWKEVCRLLRDPARVQEEYRRRLDALSGGPQRHELDAAQRHGDKLRRAIDRLIDGFAEGLIAKHEFESRIGQLRQPLARLEAEARALRNATEQARSLHLVIGRLGVFADRMRDRTSRSTTRASASRRRSSGCSAAASR